MGKIPKPLCIIKFINLTFIYHLLRSFKGHSKGIHQSYHHSKTLQRIKSCCRYSSDLSSFLLKLQLSFFLLLCCSLFNCVIFSDFMYISIVLNWRHYFSTTIIMSYKYMCSLYYVSVPPILLFLFD